MSALATLGALVLAVVWGYAMGSGFCTRYSEWERSERIRKGWLHCVGCGVWVPPSRLRVRSGDMRCGFTWHDSRRVAADGGCA